MAAVLIRVLWVKIVRRGRPPVRSPWLLVIAANLALLSIFAAIGNGAAA